MDFLVPRDKIWVKEEKAPHPRAERYIYIKIYF